MDEISQKNKKGFRARVVLVLALVFLAYALNVSLVFGQDVSSTISANEPLNGTANNAYVDFNGSNLIEDVQNIVNTSKTNYGWLIASPTSEDKGSSAQYQEFRSREASQSAQRPKLTIVYTTVNKQAAIKSGSSCEADLFGDTTNYSPNATDIYDGDANFFQDLLCFTDGDGDGFGSGDMMRVKGGDGCGMNLGGASMGYIDVHDNVAKTNGDWDWTKIGRSISQVITDLAVFDIDFGYDQYDDDDKYFQDLLCFDDADGDGYGAGSAKRVAGGNSCDEDLKGDSMDYIAVHDNIAKTDGAWDWSKIGQTVSQVSTSLDSGWGIDFSYDIYDDDDSYFQDLVCFTDIDGDGRKGGSAVSTRSGGSCGEDLKGVSRAFLFAGQGVNAGASCASNCDKYDDPSVNPNAATLYEDTICFIDEDGDGYGGGTAVAVASGAGGCGAGANYVAVGEDIDVGDACASGCDIFDDPDLYGTDEGFTPGAYQFLECYTDADGDNYSKIISDPGTTNLVGHWKLEEVPGSCAAGHTDNGDGTCTFQYSIASSADDWLLTDGPSGSNYQQTATEDFRLYKNHLYHTNALARWDTSDIPESATVNSATLTVQIQYFHNQDSRKIIFDWHDWGTGDPTSADFVDADYYNINEYNNALDGPAMTTLVAGSWSNPVQNVFTLALAGTFVSKTGMTHLRGQLTGSHTGEFSIYIADFSDAVGGPKLTVTYTPDKTAIDSSGAVTAVPVTSWQDISNIIVSGNQLTESCTPNTAWCASARSVRSVASGDMEVTWRMLPSAEGDSTRGSHVGAGIGTGASSDWGSVSFGFCNRANYYGGPVDQGTCLTTQAPTLPDANNVYKVAYESGVVNYYLNNVLTYTSPNAPIYPAFFKVGMHSGPLENLGNLYDATLKEGSNDGTVYGVSSVAGKLGNAMSFDGVDDYVGVSHGNSFDFTSSNEITISMWANGDAFDHSGGGSAPTLIAKGSQDYRIAVDPNNNNRIWARFSGLTDTTSTSSAPGLTENVFSHIAVTFDGNDVKLYYNGVLDASKSQSASLSSNSNDWTIGSHTATTNNFDGKIDDVRIYNKALTASEVKALGQMVQTTTTKTFYPDGNPETTSVDGAVRVDGGGAPWATARALSAATARSPSDATAGFGTTMGDPNQWKFKRMFLLFDTSSIPDGATIDSATVEFVVVYIARPISGSVTLVTTTPASNTDIALGDFDQIGNAYQATQITLDSIIADSSTYNVMNLNSAGLGNIDKTGITKFGLRESHDTDNIQPTWVDNGHIVVQIAMAEETLTGDKRPKLVVTYTETTVSEKVTVAAADDCPAGYVSEANKKGTDIDDNPNSALQEAGNVWQYLACYTDVDGDEYAKKISTDPGTTNLVGHWTMDAVVGSCAAGHTDNGDGTCTFQYSIASNTDDWLLTDGPSGSIYQGLIGDDFRLYKNQNYHTNVLARWDTSDIPESVTVNSATLTVQIFYFHAQEASRKIIFDWHDWGTGNPTSADFVDDDTLTNALDGPAMDTLVAGQKVFTLTNAGTFVSKTGMTHLRGQLTGSHTGEFSIYMASFGNAAGSPKLTVTYTLDKTVTDSSGKGNTGTIINCNDNIKNYGETGVDCGGSCAVCINRNCKNVYDSGSTTDGVYSINPSGSNAFSVYCDMTSHVGGWTLVATHGTANSVEFASDYGSDLTNPTVNGENLFKGTWADLDFTTAWVQLDNYNDNFYFEGWNTDTLRNELGTIMVTRRTAQSQTQPDCRHFLGSLGNPSSGGTVVSKCGNYVESQTGPISDPAGTGGWCYWNVPQSNYKGSGHCGGGYSPRKGRIWVR